MINKELFYKKMEMLFGLFNKDVTDDIYTVYYEALKGLDNSQFSKTVELIIKTCKFMPMPAEFLEITSENPETKAMLALQEVEKSFGSVGIYGNVHFIDERIGQTIQIIGGWTKICSMNDNEWKFARRDFIKIYKLLPIPTERIELRGLGGTGEVIEIGGTCQQRKELL